MIINFMNIAVKIIIVILIVVSYKLYDYIFYNPIRRRKSYRDLPSHMYKKYENLMYIEFHFMEKLPYEEVYIDAIDGTKLKGCLYWDFPNRPYIIFFHGYRSRFQWDGYGIFRYCREHGLNCLMVEQRAHGDSSAKTISFGIKERYDCLCWSKYLSERINKNNDIILAGVSMGSATVLMASDLELPSNVKGIIADCGYTSPEEIILNTGKNQGLPARILMPVASIVFRLISKMKLSDSSAIESVKNTKTPILFIHGEADDFVPLEMGKRLYNECSSIKDLLIVPNALHAVSSMENFSLYDNKITEFLKKIINMPNE